MTQGHQWPPRSHGGLLTHVNTFRVLVCSFYATSGMVGGVMAQCGYAWPQPPSFGFLGPPAGCCGYVWQITEFMSSRGLRMYTDLHTPGPGSEVCTKIRKPDFCHSPKGYVPMGAGWSVKQKPSRTILNKTSLASKENQQKFSHGKPTAG